MLEDDVADPNPPVTTQNAQEGAEKSQAMKKLRTAQADTNDKLSSLGTRVEELAAEVANINYTPKYIVGKKTHLPDHWEKVLTPRSWTTRCGWAYGMSKFRRSDDIGDRCRKCFQLTDEAEPIAETGDSSSSDSSSS